MITKHIILFAAEIIITYCVSSVIVKKTTELLKRKDSELKDACEKQKKEKNNPSISEKFGSQIMICICISSLAIRYMLMKDSSIFQQIIYMVFTVVVDCSLRLHAYTDRLIQKLYTSISIITALTGLMLWAANIFGEVYSLREIKSAVTGYMLYICVIALWRAAKAVNTGDAYQLLSLGIMLSLYAPHYSRYILLGHLLVCSFTAIISGLATGRKKIPFSPYVEAGTVIFNFFFIGFYIF